LAEALFLLVDEFPPGIEVYLYASGLQLLAFRVSAFTSALIIIEFNPMNDLIPRHRISQLLKDCSSVESFE
jgi:hypothetical protein